MRRKVTEYYTQCKKDGSFSLRDAPVNSAMRHPPKPLLTGWSLVRIRPGEPSNIKGLANKIAQGEIL